MFPFNQHGSSELAYQKGYEKGLAASEPTRVVTVNLSSFSVPPDTLGIPRWISLKLPQDTPIRHVLSEIQQRCGDIKYPYTISTVGSDARELHLEDDLIIMEILPKYDAEAVSLRMNVQVPKGDKKPKKGLGARLRSALGGGNDRSGGPQTAAHHNSNATSSGASLRSQPPPYDEATRTVR